MDLGTVDLFKYGYATFMMRRPNFRRHAAKAPRLRDLFELYAVAVFTRDRLIRANADAANIEAKNDACVGLENEISFFLEHTAGSPLADFAPEDGFLPGA